MLRGKFAAEESEFCHRRILARIHRLTLGRLRREIEPVSAAAFMRFLCRWQHLAPGSQLHGIDGLFQILRQLQGYEISAAAWESTVLPRRVAAYEPEWLDRLCLAGEVMWGRLSPHPALESEGGRRVRPRASLRSRSGCGRMHTRCWERDTGRLRFRTRRRTCWPRSNGAELRSSPIWCGLPAAWRPRSRTGFGN